MLPVSLEVTSQPLLFCPQQHLDFGVVQANDPPKTLKLFVINSGSKPITVQVFFDPIFIIINILLLYNQKRNVLGLHYGRVMTTVLYIVPQSLRIPMIIEES